MKLLLTSGGVTNATISAALRDLLGKPVEESTALLVVTGMHPWSGAKQSAHGAVAGTWPGSPTRLGWRSIGLLEFTALPSMREEAWVPELERTDALLVWGGDVLYLRYWMEESGLAALLPTLSNLVYVGVSAGSIVVTPVNHDAEADLGNVPEGSARGADAERGLGFVDFTLVPHLDGEKFLPEHSLASIGEWAAGVPVPTYALDDESAISVHDGSVQVVSEGRWHLFDGAQGVRTATATAAT